MRKKKEENLLDIVEKTVTKKKTVKVEPKTTKTSVKTKTSKPSTPKVEKKVPTRHAPACWKEMKKIDEKITKLTKDLKTTLEKGIKTIESHLELEKDFCTKEDLKDYSEWIKALNTEMGKYSNFGKEKFDDI